MAGSLNKIYMLIIDYGRCFPHVVNIAVQTGLKYLSATSFDRDVLDPFEEELATPEELKNDTDYRTALETDAVLSARQLVVACRASGQRRDDIARVIRDGNMQGGWGTVGQPLRVVTLLMDMEIRWSSTFLMIDRMLELAPVRFLKSPIESS